MKNEFTKEQIKLLEDDLTEFVKKICEEIMDKADWIRENYGTTISLICLKKMLIEITALVFPLHQNCVKKEKRLQDLMGFFQEMECRINENSKKLEEANNEN